MAKRADSPTTPHTGSSTGSGTTPAVPAARPGHLAHLKQLPTSLLTSDGLAIQVWELTVSLTDPCIGDWAAHFREHYCPTTQLDELRAGTGLSRADFLTTIIFPDSGAAPGPAIRAGDFAELLVSDYVEYVLNLWVPRGKYAAKEVRNESIKGVDILGFRWLSPPARNVNDLLLAFEVKARLTGTAYDGHLQTAIDDSSKDYLRRAFSLNAIKRRLLLEGQRPKADVVERFQNPSDYPYTYRSGAAAVLSDAVYDEALIQSQTVTAQHHNAANLDLIVIRGQELMRLVHALYDRAAHDA